MVLCLWCLIILVIENNISADTDSQEFINHIGDILVVLLDEQLKQKKELNGEN